VSRENMCENPAIPFAIKKRINPKLFIDWMAALYTGKTQIRVVSCEQWGCDKWADCRFMYIPCAEIKSWTKKFGNERPGVNNLSWDDFNGINVIRIF